MHIEILSDKQKDLFSLISEFKKDYYLVGGTAIGLHLGHRDSIDFDLFSYKPIKRKKIKNIILKNGFTPDKVIYEAFDQMHLIINSVKLTFFQFPHKINATINLNNIIKIPNLIDLAAMKAYALGGRAKWKDYVDLYFILKNHYSLKQITDNSLKIFGDFFNSKLFKEQLTYFNDINYTEPIIYLGQEQPTENEIKDFLVEQALTEF